MSDFLTRLALRQLGQIATIEPRVAPLYGAAKETQNPSFAEDTEYRPATNAQEAVAMPERTPFHASAHVGAQAGDTDPATHPPLVQKHPGSNDPMRRMTAQSLTTESRANKEGRFTAEVSTVSPGRSFIDVSQKYQPEETAMLRQERVVVLPMSKTAPVAPVSLVEPAQSESALRSNEFATALGGEENRRREQAQREAPVHVTIGRIEVTAMTAAAPAKRAPARKQTMSLDDYLARRQGRDR
jgi:hypothetical protein